MSAQQITVSGEFRQPILVIYSAPEPAVNARHGSGLENGSGATAVGGRG